MTGNNQKVSLVTGGAGEIGQAIVRSLLSKQHHVIINYKGSEDEQAALNLVSSIGELKDHVKLVRADICKSNEVETMFEEGISWKGQLHSLVNNAAIGLFKPILEFTQNDINTIVGVNFFGTLYTCQCAARYLANGGSIVNLSSSSTSQMLPGYGLYSATKAAVEQLSRVLAKELGPKNINVNVVSPGPIDTDAFYRGKTNQFVEQLKKLSPHNRIGKPEEVADLVAYLISKDSSWVNGQVIKVNGGAI